MAMPAWVSEVGVAASVSIAVAAIWGEKLRGLFRPRLRLRLHNLLGHLETLAEVSQSNPASIQFGPARYYHLAVTNYTSYPEARDVEVLLTQVSIRGPDGKPQTIFEGVLPLMWQHEPHYPSFRTIGRTTVAIADLLLVRPDQLRILVKVQPLNFAETMRGEQHLWLKLVARGVNGESRPLRLKIDWDGQWERSDSEMQKHLIVQEVAQ